MAFAVKLHPAALRILLLMSLCLPPADAAAVDHNALRRAAEQGDAGAQLALAIRLRDGNGEEKNPAEAMRWAHLAADAGHAAFNLGQCYYGAQGTEQDCAKALEWWEKAASQGHGRAAAAAAMAHLSGEGVPRDAGKARRLAERAVELGNASGLVLLGELHYQAGDVEAAREHWTRAARLHPTGDTGHPAQPSDQASAQQGADLLKLLPYRQRPGEPGKFAFVPMPHIYQGYNNCGASACAAFARFHGSDISGWDFKKLCPSPLGTGTDWWHLLDASKKIRQRWKLVRFTPDEVGFEQAAALLRSELDAGRPVVVDFKYIGPQYAGGFAGHTLNVCGYLAEEDFYILCNPAVAKPGLQLITAADLKNFWRSDHYGAQAKGVLARPAFVLDLP